MASNKNPRRIIEGKLRCGSKRHVGDRMVPVEWFSKKITSPDGMSYDCKECRTKYNAEASKRTHIKWKSNNPISALLSGRRSDAKKKGLDFTITEADVNIPDTCPVLGIPIICTAGVSRTDNSPSLDRIDNMKGYIPGNVVVVSWRANLLKKNASIKELTLMYKFYSKYDRGVLNE